MRNNRRAVASSGRSVRIVGAAAAASLAAVSAALATVPPPTTRPADWNNAGGDGAYVNPANWNPALASAPANDNNEFLTINNGGTAVIGTGDSAQGAFVNLGLRPGDTGTLLITGGSLTAGELRVGGRETLATDLTDWSLGTPGNGGGTGTVVQSGSSVVNVNFTHGTDPNTGSNFEPPAQSTYVGDSGLDSGNTARGSYTIKDNATLLNGLQNNDQLVVGTGPGAQGTFTQLDNSTVTSTGTVIVGRRGATGSYSISGGTLTAQTTNTSALIIGDGENTTGAQAGTIGSFTQTGGTVTVAKAMELGRRGGTGTYTISAGTLNTGQFNVGTTSSSTADGTTTPVGTFSLSGTGSVNTSAGNNVFIGFNGASPSYSPTLTATGNFNQSGGTMTLYSTLFILGSGAGATGTANISGGTLQGNAGIKVEVDIARNSGSGTFNLSGDGNVNVANFYIGGNANSIGADATANISGGTLTATTALVLSATANAGTDSTRTLNITGGTVTAASFNQNTSNPGSAVTRTFNMSGGTFTVTGNTTGGFGTTYNITGGTADFQGTYTTNASTLNVGGTADVTIHSLNPSGTQGGWINLSGGTLTCPDFHAGFNSAANPATFTQTGGTLNATTFTSGGTQTRLNFSGGTTNIGTLVLSAGTVLTTDNDISLPSNLTLGSTNSAGTNTVNVNSGSLTLSGPVSFFGTNPSFTLNKTGPGALTLSGAHTHTAPLTLAPSDGTLNLNVDVGPNTALNATGGTTNLNASQTLSSLSITGGLVDLLTNSLTLPSPAPNLTSYLASAYNSGTWTGTTGLTSSAAKNRADQATGIGYYDNGAQVQVKYTWMGDLNLDGKIDGDDYTLIDRGFANHLTTWTNGDVDYDGSVTVADYAVMDAAFGHQNGGLSPAFLAMRQAEFGDAYVQSLVAAVPEPGCGLAFVGAAIAAGVRRRRRG